MLLDRLANLHGETRLRLNSEVSSPAWGLLSPNSRETTMSHVSRRRTGYAYLVLVLVPPESQVTVAGKRVRCADGSVRIVECTTSTIDGVLSIDGRAR